MKKLSLLLFSLILSASSLWADEGMWLPFLLEKYNIEEMQAAGFKLTAEDIYSVNQISMKDAVIGLGRAGRPFRHFCTAGLISEEGLVVTNHHCAYDMIQSHSTIEHNYLEDGFWAEDFAHELANPGITASILVRMEDVTSVIMSAVLPSMSQVERNSAIQKVSQELIQNAEAGTLYSADIKPFFNGNQYILSVYKIFKDVRLVGAPPSSIGKFGGDTDNWVWPRHTGDFSVLRIYASPDNQPADYAEENVPYRPECHFAISSKGLKEGDFTMVFGYPGTTYEYVPSFDIAHKVNTDYPTRVNIRTIRLGIINAAMASDPVKRIQYASKAAGISNSWKKWIGEIQGINRFNTIARKEALESELLAWAGAEGDESAARLIERYRALYEELRPYSYLAANITEAGLSGAELIAFANTIRRLAADNFTAEDVQTAKNLAEAFYKDFDSATDETLFTATMRIYDEAVKPEWKVLPARYQKYEAIEDPYARFARDIYAKTIFADAATFLSVLNNTTDMEKLAKIVNSDPVGEIAYRLTGIYNSEIAPETARIQTEIGSLSKEWMALLMRFQPNKRFYPDANSTLRVSYGKIAGYEPVDGVQYHYSTNLRGILEKENPEIYDYVVTDKLKSLFSHDDFGGYNTQDGEVPVCFIATNHTTGGNSGSPVLNAEGELIGINFDRDWEGVMSDHDFQPEICRNIAVDIRFVLFVIDRYANARHLIEEMDIRW